MTMAMSMMAAYLTLHLAWPLSPRLAWVTATLL